MHSPSLIYGIFPGDFGSIYIYSIGQQGKPFSGCIKKDSVFRR